MSTSQSQAAGLRLRTIRRASEESGASQSFFKQLIRQGKLKRYKINSSTFVSLTDFENVATAEEQVAKESIQS